MKYHSPSIIVAKIFFKKTILSVVMMQSNYQLLYIAGGNIKWYSCPGKQIGSFWLNRHLPYESAIPLLDIFHRERRTDTHANTCRQMLMITVIVKPLLEVGQ